MVPTLDLALCLQASLKDVNNKLRTIMQAMSYNPSSYFLYLEAIQQYHKEKSTTYQDSMFTPNTSIMDTVADAKTYIKYL